jgi:glycosyltransferase involved in cell wall biosynthesis
VIIPAFNARKTIGAALDALSRQDTSLPYEVIVVDSGTDGAAALVRGEYPSVLLLDFPERKYAGHARNLGIARSRGEVLAFTDADCVAPPNWIDTVGRLHGLTPDGGAGAEGTTPPVIGGAVKNGNPEAYLGWGYYLTEFNNWLPGLPATSVPDVPGCCWTMKRWVYEKYGPFIEGTYCSDSAFHWKMAEDGLRPAFAPELFVYHFNLEELREYVAHEVHHGRCFANVRVQEREMSRSEAFSRALSAPTLPALLFVRACKRVLRSGDHRAQMLRTAPVVTLGMTAWSLGELLGYAAHAAGRRPPAR